MGSTRSLEPVCVGKANQYIRDVLDGTIPACKYVKAACQRQLDDLARQDDPEFPYEFDEQKAERVIRLIQEHPHIKGRKFADKPLILEPWQCFIVAVPFGWVEKETGFRRFRRSYTEVPKGNGKSPLAAALSNVMCFLDDEPGAEVYACATSVEQAKVVFEVSQAMLRKMPDLCERKGIDVLAHSIVQPASNSYYKIFSSERNSPEGTIPYFICCDELHAHPNRHLYDNLDNANGKRDGSMLWAISTAGDDRAGICYEVRGYVADILDGKTQDETVFGIIYTLDENDDWATPESWRKANPNWGVSVPPGEIASKAKKAIQIASAQPTFKIKHLNLWENSDHAWMNMRKWAQCVDKSMKIEDFVGRNCFTGLDLGRKLDILAKINIFWEDRVEESTDETGQVIKQNKRHYWLFGKYWTPEEQLEQTENSQYKGWAKNGFLQTCWGSTNDYDDVERDIREDCRKYQVLEVGHDPWSAVQLVNNLTKDKIPMVEVGQIAKNLSEPMKELEAAVEDGRLHFDGDPVLTWAVGNVVCHLDKNDNLFPNKESQDKKIDPVSALLNGLNRLMFYQPKPKREFKILFPGGSR